MIRGKCLILRKVRAGAEIAILRRAQEAQAAAQAMGLAVQSVGVRGIRGFDAAFAGMTGMTRKRPGALLTTVEPFTATHRKRIVDLAGQQRLPAICEARDCVESGGLMASGPSFTHRSAWAA